MQKMDVEAEGVQQEPAFHSSFLTNLFGRCLNKTPYQPLPRRGDGDIGAGHVGRYLSLANGDRASKMVCHVPAIITFGITGIFLLTLFYSQSAFVALCIIIGSWMFGWASYMGMCSYFGVKAMRRDCRIDWGKQWDEHLARNPGCDEGMLHFVILPNYAEDEELLAQTIANVANNKLAKKYMVVVLAMEAREGVKGERKAQNLIERHRHLFHAIFATYHPENIPGEVKGKSSNTQWAFRDVQRWYGTHVSQNQDVQHDASKVFLTVADADSLHHPEYFANLTLKGLQLSSEERAWTMFQPPILNWRNYETVPGPVRTTSYGTFLFEVSGLVASPVFDHLTFSTYTLTLALANHPIVDGWDADVIAEDHHMYMKCLCASYWEELFSQETNRSVRNLSKLRLQPLWTPVTSYLVEDSRGVLYSIWARYNQARRHLQGIAELSYLILQHWTIARESREPIPWAVHLQLSQLCLKYTTVTILNSVHTLILLLFFLAASYWTMQALLAGNAFQMLTIVAKLRQESGLIDLLCYSLQLFTPAMCTVVVGANWMAVKDSREGLYCPLWQVATHEDYEDLFEDHQYGRIVRDKRGNALRADPLSSPSEIADARRNDECVLLSRKMTLYGQAKAFCQVYTDMNVIGQPTLLLYGTIPLFLTAVSLSRYGHKFDYIVAAKPETKGVQGDAVGKKLEQISSTSAGSSSCDDGDLCSV